MSDMKAIEINIHDLLGLSEPLKKLIETTSIGVGKLYEPLHIKRLVKAKAIEMQTISDAVTDNIGLPIKYENGSINVNSEDTNDLIKRTQNRLLFQEIQKQQNIDSVVAGTYDILERETVVSEEPVDKDWIIRFFNSVEDISNQDLQQIWSKILAGEIKQPKSFSVRTLELLHNISYEEAMLFEKICKSSIYINDSLIVFANDEFMLNQGINYGNILKLNECGLINAIPYMSMELTQTKEETILYKNSDFVIFAIPNSNIKKLSISNYSFTSIGKELAKLNDNDKTDEQMLLQFAKILSKINTNFNFALHKVLKNSNDEEDKITFDRYDLISGELRSH